MLGTAAPKHSLYNKCRGIILTSVKKYFFLSSWEYETLTSHLIGDANSQINVSPSAKFYCKNQQCHCEKENWVPQLSILEATASGSGCCSVTQSCPTLCDLMDCSLPGFPVLHHLPNSCPLSRCHPTISASIVPFSSCKWWGLQQIENLLLLHLKEQVLLCFCWEVPL